MYNFIKVKLFQTFLSQWGEQFNKLPELERFLEFYPYVQEKIEEIPLISSHELEEYQLEWVSLIERLEHPIEREFFKPWWVPLSKYEYEYFLDLSAQPFSIFKVDFCGVETKYWFIKEVVPDISVFILGLENGTIGIHKPTEDEDGNPLDEYGKPIKSETIFNLPIEWEDEFTGYDSVLIDYNATLVSGYFIESPIEARLIKWFNYIPADDNAKKPYKAWWEIQKKKLMLHLANAKINGKRLYTGDIFPESEEFPEDEYLYPFTSFSGILTFVLDKIEEPGYFSFDLNIGDKVLLSIKDGIVTSFDKSRKI